MRLVRPTETAAPETMSRTGTGGGRAEARPYHKISTLERAISSRNPGPCNMPADKRNETGGNRATCLPIKKIAGSVMQRKEGYSRLCLSSDYVPA